MKTVMEIFYLRIVGKSVWYQRKQAGLSRRGGDPDRVIRSFIHEKRSASSGKVEEKEFIVHSTSWRYAKPNRVILTYVAYSDELEFGTGKGKSTGNRKAKSLPLTRLRTITKKSRKPRSRTELEKKVVSHAMRHIAFLIQTGDQDDFKSALKPETIKAFEKLWVSLAGKVLS
jgi:hypothetical protein